MRLVCTSDTHGFHRRWYRNIGALPAGEIFIVAGDITTFGNITELKDFNDWIAMLKRIYGYREVIVIAGNHDKCLEETPVEIIRKEFLKDCIYLFDSETVIDGIKFYGSPWTPEYGNWSFMKDDDELEVYWELIPIDTNVLITHGPSVGILDKTGYGKLAGSTSLYKTLLLDLQEHLKVHIFGHIHEAHGEIKLQNTRFCNCSAVNMSLNSINHLYVIEI